MARTRQNPDGTVDVDPRNLEELAHDIADGVEMIKELLQEIRDLLSEE